MSDLSNFYQEEISKRPLFGGRRFSGEARSVQDEVYLTALKMQGVEASLAPVVSSAELGTSSLSRLSVSMVQSFLNQKISEGHSVRKVQIIRTVLSAALGRAVREELVGRNVARRF